MTRKILANIKMLDFDQKNSFLPMNCFHDWHVRQCCQVTQMNQSNIKYRFKCWLIETRESSSGIRRLKLGCGNPSKEQKETSKGQRLESNQTQTKLVIEKDENHGKKRGIKTQKSRFTFKK